MLPYLLSVQYKDIYSSLDYFHYFDYILGDWSYGKLRLKGFCDKSNPKFNKINDYATKESYITNDCAYNCKYFVLKKVKNT